MDQFSERNPAQEASVAQSKVSGDYYRDLANNYADYIDLDNGIQWPYRPSSLPNLDD